MFDSLSDRLGEVFSGLRSRGRLSEEDVTVAIREIRLALLEADVNFDVVKSFVATIKERALGAEVTDSLTPGQEVIRIVHEELTRLMGEGSTKLSLTGNPAVVLVCGLQGSGKTTTCGKLAKLIEGRGKKPALVACDVYRPAAIQQLVMVGAQAGVPVYERGADEAPVEIAKWGIQRAKEEGRDVVIIDTAGRLTVDKDLMGELVRIRDAVRPKDTLLVLDSMTGQDAVATAQAFLAAIAFDGLILTKLDGDARGGAALSVRAITGVPIKVITTGEKLDQIEEFHADRLASRILGMGDVLSLIEKAEQLVDQDKAAELERKIKSSEFGLDDMLDQLRTIRKMGSLTSVLGMLPGVGKQLKNTKIDDRQLDRVEAIILSMTPEERSHPQLIKGSRRARIAAGSGSTAQQVNDLLKQHEQMKKMMKQFATGKKPKMPMLPPGINPKM